MIGYKVAGGCGVGRQGPGECEQSPGSKRIRVEGKTAIPMH